MEENYVILVNEPHTNLLFSKMKYLNAKIGNLF